MRRYLETPADVLGIPDGARTLELVNSTVDEGYSWPSRTNVHHLCYPRNSYNNDPLERAFRESGGLMVRIPIQANNLLHAEFLPPEKPSRDVMQARVIEQREFDTLFELGRRTIRFAKWAMQLRSPTELLHSVDFRDAHELAQYYELMSATYERRYQSFLENIDDRAGQTGLRPHVENLVNIPEATRRLGKIAGQGFVSAHRATQERRHLDLAA